MPSFRTRRRRPSCTRLLEMLAARGFDFACGVPCSLLQGLLEARRGPFLYLSSVREDEAIGVAAGAHSAGRRPIVPKQNSGLGNGTRPTRCRCCKEPSDFLYARLMPVR